MRARAPADDLRRRLLRATSAPELPDGWREAFAYRTWGLGPVLDVPRGDELMLRSLDRPSLFVLQAWGWLHEARH